jgi:hypothetical protein
LGERMITGRLSHIKVKITEAPPIKRIHPILLRDFSASGPGGGAGTSGGGCGGSAFSMAFLNFHAVLVPGKLA